MGLANGRYRLGFVPDYEENPVDVVKRPGLGVLTPTRWLLDAISQANRGLFLTFSSKVVVDDGGSWLDGVGGHSKLHTGGLGGCWRWISDDGLLPFLYSLLLPSLLFSSLFLYMSHLRPPTPPHCQWRVYMGEGSLFLDLLTCPSYLF